MQCGRPGFDPCLWRQAWQPTPVFLPGEFPGQRSLAGYSPGGPKESDTTEWLSTQVRKSRPGSTKFPRLMPQFWVPRSPLVSSTLPQLTLSGSLLLNEWEWGRTTHVGRKLWGWRSEVSVLTQNELWLPFLHKGLNKPTICYSVDSSENWEYRAKDPSEIWRGQQVRAKICSREGDSARVRTDRIAQVFIFMNCWIEDALAWVRKETPWGHHLRGPHTLVGLTSRKSTRLSQRGAKKIHSWLWLGEGKKNQLRYAQDCLHKQRPSLQASMNLRSHNDPTPVLLTQGGAGYPRDSCEELSPGTLPAKSGMELYLVLSSGLVKNPPCNTGDMGSNPGWGTKIPHARDQLKAPSANSACVLRRVRLFDPHGLQPPRLHCPWNFPGKNTGVGCHFLLQGILLTQGSNPRLLCLLRWRVDSLPLSHLGNPG